MADNPRPTHGPAKHHNCLSHAARPDVAGAQSAPKPRRWGHGAEEAVAQQLAWGDLLDQAIGTALRFNHRPHCLGMVFTCRCGFLFLTVRSIPASASFCSSPLAGQESLAPSPNCTASNSSGDATSARTSSAPTLIERGIPFSHQYGNKLLDRAGRLPKALITATESLS